jgi:hypothetical protein
MNVFTVEVYTEKEYCYLGSHSNFNKAKERAITVLNSVHEPESSFVEICWEILDSGTAQSPIIYKCWIDEGGFKEEYFHDFKLTENDYDIKIELDTSGVTYGYSLLKNDESFLFSDGFESKEKIKKELSELRDCLNSVELR